MAGTPPQRRIEMSLSTYINGFAAKMSQTGRENFVYTRWRGAPAPILPIKDETVRTPYFKKQLAKSSNNLANYCFLLANFCINERRCKSSKQRYVKG